MSITLEQLSARMRQGEQVPLRHTAQVALTLSIPSILQQIVVTAMEYIDAAMVGHIGAAATASIGIVSSSTWLLHGMLAGLCMAFSIQVAQYLGADRQQDARGVLRQSMLFNLVVGLAAAAFGVGISRFLPGWLGADTALQANASAYFAIWSASLPFIMAMGTYAAMLRSTGDALTPGLISVFTCVLSMSSRERLYTKISNFATEESINFILNMLYACYFSKDYEKNLDFKTKASRILEFERFSENSDIQEKPQT